VFAVAVTADKTLAVGGGENGSLRVWDVTTRAEVARWTGDYPIIGCTALPGRPLTIGVGQRRGPPLLVEPLGTRGWRPGESPEANDHPEGPPGAEARRPLPGSAAATIGTGEGHLAV
jgi:hypothetical protein